MTRASLPALAGLLALLAGCSQNRYDPDPYPQQNRGYPQDNRGYGGYSNGTSFSPARRALEMKGELRLNDRQIQQLAMIERDFNRDGNRYGGGYRDDRQVQRDRQGERHEVDRVLNRRQRDILRRSWGR